MERARRVLVLAEDLMVRSRIEAAAPDACELVFADNASVFEEQLNRPPDLILVGMTATRLPWADLIRAARQSPAAQSVPILAFGPHMNLGLRARALEAGANRVIANSALMNALPGLLRGETPRESDE
jgi:PleD family two-component response regulator